MSGRRNHPRRSRARRDSAPAIRYPNRSVIDELLPAMVARRSGTPTTDAGLVHVWGFTGTGESGDGNAAGVAEFSPDDAPMVAGSPILDIAGRMMTGMGGRLWGFGLAYRTLADAVLHEADTPAQSSTAGEPDQPERQSTTEQVWAARIFDARGREYSYLRYVHLPALEPITWDCDTVDEHSTAREWIDCVDQGVIAAHVWAAAMALDADRNRSVLAQLERRLLS